MAYVWKDSVHSHTMNLLLVHDRHTDILDYLPFEFNLYELYNYKLQRLHSTSGSPVRF